MKISEELRTYLEEDLSVRFPTIDSMVEYIIYNQDLGVLDGEHPNLRDEYYEQVAAPIDESEMKKMVLNRFLELLSSEYKIVPLQ